MSAVEPVQTPTFVPIEELLAAFDAVQISKLKRLLIYNHIKYFVNVAGHPVVTHNALDSALKLAKNKEEDTPQVGPDLGWIRKLNEKAGKG